MTGTAIVVQARVASSRLPGKALAPIGARSILAHCLVRMRLANIAPVVLATTTKAEDDALVEVAARYGARVIRGPEHDVLKRFALAARELGVDTIVRATADNPAVDIEAVRRTVAALRSLDADHAVESDLPYGAAVEAVTTQALFRADAEATDPADREHVTTFIRRDASAFRALTVAAPFHLRRPDLRMTVDTPDDLLYMRRLSESLGGWCSEPELAEVIAAADAWSARERCA